MPRGLGKGELAVRLLATLLGNQLGYDTLGSNNAFNLANLNQNSLLSSLGGL